MDLNETAKQASAREVLEETGWKVTDITLLRVNDNPNRPNEDRQNIAFVYFCTATKKVGESDSESDEVRWFSFDQLPPREQMAFDHMENIELYLKYKAESLPLPVTD
jgi:ADP-ribose pyrophosphatase YjhB (NUDIX family)